MRDQLRSNPKESLGSLELKEYRHGRPNDHTPFHRPNKIVNRPSNSQQEYRYQNINKNNPCFHGISSSDEHDPQNTHNYNFQASHKLHDSTKSYKEQSYSNCPLLYDITQQNPKYKHKSFCHQSNCLPQRTKLAKHSNFEALGHFDLTNQVSHPMPPKFKKAKIENLVAQINEMTVQEQVDSYLHVFPALSKNKYKKYTRKLRHSCFATQFKKAIVSNSRFMSLNSDINLFEQEYFRDACRMLEINWFDGLIDDCSQRQKDMLSPQLSENHEWFNVRLNK